MINVPTDHHVHAHTLTYTQPDSGPLMSVADDCHGGTDDDQGHDTCKL